MEGTYKSLPYLTHSLDAILGTFQDNGGGMFWTIASKMPVQANPIVCWKFLQVVHKLMRDGHPNVSIYIYIYMTGFVCLSVHRAKLKWVETDFIIFQLIS